MMKKLIALLLAFAMIFTAGCSKTGGNSLMEDITPGPVAATGENPTVATGAADFGARLFAASAREGENALISPASMLYALAMIANGAEGDTLAQLEAAFGCNTDRLNLYLHQYIESSRSISIANAVWVREGFAASRDFLQTNADYYGRGVYTAPFDNSTVKDINNYVKKNTDGMIDKIIDQLNPATVMCLVNALTFRDEWQVEYEKKDIRDGVFTDVNGRRQDVQFMYSAESQYLQDENTTGFVKKYKNGDRFVALLPREGVDINRYIRRLNGEKLETLLANSSYGQVNAFIPEFESRYGSSMIEIMEKLGVADLFDPQKADLSAMGDSDTGLYISTLLHKTYISVDRRGTKAAAITFATADECAAAEPANVYTVRLDRPFVYMILPRDSPLPLFTGCVMTIEG